MSDFFKEFNPASRAEWEAKLIADLKGKDPAVLKTVDNIEEIEFLSYAHQDDVKTSPEVPGSFPYTRGMNRANNDWKNGAKIIVKDEKEANKEALEALNLGADMLFFEQHKTLINWGAVLNKIQLEFIETHFAIQTIESFQQLYKIQHECKGEIDLQIDFLTNESNKIEDTIPFYKEAQKRFCVVNGFAIQQAGATTWQEVAFCLNVGHEYLVKLLNGGLSIDQAAACISFNIGVGANFFYEIGKIRSFKRLWSKIIQAYNPEHSCSYNCKINVQVGHLNKSILDPHTNLLRQTTEAMSAAISGVSSITVLPHDLYSSNRATVLSRRMAINISTILKEESHLANVIDPLGGSYSIDKLTDLIGEKAWSLFQNLDENGGVFEASTLDYFTAEIKAKREERILSFNDGKTIGIGINKFKNPEIISAHWVIPEQYLGLEPLILENELKLQTV